MQQQPCAVNSKLITEVYYSYEQPQPCIGRNVFFFFYSMETQSKAVAVKTCGVLPLLLRWKTANQIEQPAPPKKKKHRLSQCMHGNGNAFTVEDNFLSFHILSTARRSGTRNKYGGLAQKIKRRGKQQAARHDLHLLPSSSTSGSSRR